MGSDFSCKIHKEYKHITHANGKKNSDKDGENADCDCDGDRSGDFFFLTLTNKRKSFEFQPLIGSRQKI